jgi:multicomponent Na+:H+ antiporter subunit A
MLDPGLQLLGGVTLPFAAALLVLLAGRALGRLCGWLVLGAALGSVALLGGLALAPGPAPTFHYEWMPALGVSLDLRGDPFGLFFALLVSGVGTLVATYAIAYLSGEAPPALRRFFAALATFMGAMLGVALADDLIFLFVCWELTSLSSFTLIGYRFEDETARAGAVKALLVTALGGLVMSVGFLLVGQLAGTFSLSSIVSDPATVAAVLHSPLAGTALVCILAGAFTKSAQFPFHFWLPRAMVAPTPVSAYLHAATMVKAGVFLIGRMLPIFGDHALWSPLLVTVGTVSLLLGAWQTSREFDLKAVLARSTGATLGLIVLLYGLKAADQDALQMLSHALYKGALFLVVGIVEHRTHTRDLRELGGLGRRMPVVFAVFAVAALSMAGVPPLLGFLSKESFFGAVLESPVLAPWARVAVMSACVTASAFLIVAAWRMTTGIFLGEPHAKGARGHHGPEDHAEGHDHAEPMLVGPPLVLASGAAALGLLGAGPFTANLVSHLSSKAGAHLSLSLLPHPGGALYASLAAFALAALLHRGRGALASLADRLRGGPTADSIWDGAIAGIQKTGEIFSRRWENGVLRWYLGATLACLPLLAYWTLGRVGLSGHDIRASFEEVSWYGLLCCAMLAVATIAAVRARTRLAAAITTTVVGFVVAMLFVVYRSPDILLTQVLIETVSTIFLLLVLVHLPPFRLPDLAPASRLVHAAVSAAVGLCVTGLVLLAMTPGLRETDNIATRPGGLLAKALAEGGGANAVNVIIVDIRATDTTGEITVLVVVGLCIYGLLRTRRRTA